MKYLIFIIAVLTCLSSCRKEINSPDFDAEKIFGTWEWYLSTGAWTMTPESEGETIKREYTNKGIIKGYKNDKKDYKTSFEFIESSGIWSSVSSFMIKYKDKKSVNLVSEVYHFIGNDTLILYPECNDCHIQYFVRVK